MRTRNISINTNTITKEEQEKIFETPEPSRFEEIVTNSSNHFCDGPNHQWTPWNSATTSNGSDYETLLNHQNIFG